MKCTRCGEHIKPVVAVDIDGTLGDYHGHFLRFAEQYLGRGLNPAGELNWYVGQCSFRKWFCDVTDTDERTWQDIKLAYRQGAQKRSMPIYNGARTFCKLIRSAGAELWLTTTRPYLRLDNVDPDTRFWLQLHGIAYDGLLYDEHKYQQLAERVAAERVVAVVDDLEEMWDEAASAFHWRVPILRRTNYNQAVRSDNAADDFTQLWGMVEPRIKEWEHTHE